MTIVNGQCILGRQQYAQILAGVPAVFKIEGFSVNYREFRHTGLTACRTFGFYVRIISRDVLVAFCSSYNISMGLLYENNIGFKSQSMKQNGIIYAPLLVDTGSETLSILGNHGEIRISRTARGQKMHRAVFQSRSDANEQRNQR